MRTPSALALALLALAACNPGREPPPPPPPAQRPAPPPPRPPTTLSALVKTAIAIEPDGTERALIVDIAPQVHPASTFRVELVRRLPDVRVALLDGDAMIPAEGSRELGEGTVVTLKPSAALAPGVNYRLRIDGASTRQAHDEQGNAFEPLNALVRTAEGPEPEPKAARRKR